jgi:D-glycero-alpha-D-manno-heptose 1-phosphate guanylyltransferase
LCTTLKMTILKKSKSLSEAVILCGGLGTRLRSIFPNIPKCIVPFKGKPFLEILIEVLTNKKIKKIILCTGYLNHLLENAIGKTDSTHIIFSNETKVLGTGGALKNALKLVNDDFYLALNGDSFCDFDIEKIIDFHLNNSADCTILVIKSSDNKSDVGMISINEKTRKILKFNEKDPNANSGYINAGVYVLNKDIFSLIKQKNFSLERDFIPEMLGKKNFFAFQVAGPLFDIGTPSGYKEFECHYLKQY